LKSFFQSRREIENISKSVRDGTANNKVDNKVTELKANLQDVAKSTSKLQRATQESLHESHVAIAVTEDVARMLHCPTSAAGTGTEAMCGARKDEANHSRNCGGQYNNREPGQGGTVYEAPSSGNVQ
jgi:uncharacterized protein YigA (DUF484 family)